MSAIGLIHLESHFTDEKAGVLRAETYRRLRRHWQFINELDFFEIQHQKRFGINVYGFPRSTYFLQAASLYHPDTVEQSLKHDGSGVEPGIKDPAGKWDLRPHASRIVIVDENTLRSWHAILETGDVPIIQTRMVYAVNKSTSKVLEKLAAVPRVSSLSLQFSPGWHEKNDRVKGFFDSEWGVPESWDQVILQGSHLGVGRPLYKYPNETMLHNTDWTEVDLEAIGPDELPVTSYKPRGDLQRYNDAYTHWKTESSGLDAAARTHYRLAWRNMAANTGGRTFIAAIIPPGAAHIHGISSVGDPSSSGILALASGFSASLLHDFAVRSAPKSTISLSTFNRLPFVNDARWRSLIILRILRLNCLTSAYSDLWRRCYDDSFIDDSWTNSGLSLLNGPALGDVTCEWNPQTPLRREVVRRQALLEIDVLVALSLDVTSDELCTIYRTQFPVLHGYDSRSLIYDADGRLVPSSTLRQLQRQIHGLTADPSVIDRSYLTDKYDYRPPFRLLDRESDMRLAFDEFQARAAALSSNFL